MSGSAQHQLPLVAGEKSVGPHVESDNNPMRSLSDIVGFVICQFLVRDSIMQL